jgi:hypothetical protein
MDIATIVYRKAFPEKISPPVVQTDLEKILNLKGTAEDRLAELQDTIEYYESVCAHGKGTPFERAQLEKYRNTETTLMLAASKEVKAVKEKVVAKSRKANRAKRKSNEPDLTETEKREGWEFLDSETSADEGEDLEDEDFVFL